jgi:hypothetical protein
VPEVEATEAPGIEGTEGNEEMEMTERRAEDERDSRSRLDSADVDDTTDEERGIGAPRLFEEGASQARRGSGRVLTRINGWSLVLALTANLLLVLLAVATGPTMVGVAACGAVGVTSWLLILAEILSVRRL